MAMLVELNGVSLKLGASLVLDDVSLTIEKRSLTVICGLSGSGKTVLGGLIAGKREAGEGEVRFKAGVRERTVWVPQQHDFRTWMDGGSYYQQRYDNTFGGNLPRVSNVLSLEAIGKSRLKDVLERLRVDGLMDKLVLELSNGESKRIQLAIALLGDPALLILDNPWVGLDMETRVVLPEVFDMLLSRDVSILLLCGIKDVPETRTSLFLLHEGKLMRKDSRSSIEQDLMAVNEKGERGRLQALPSGIIGIGQEADLFTNAVEMKGVTVRYGEKTILENIDWTVRKGERWALMGPNGSGKSTLLSLINGDNPKAYTNKVAVFDKQRGTGESIWELKSKIGFVSPELHLFFQRSPSFTESLAVAGRSGSVFRNLVFTCFDCVTSGFNEQIGWSGNVTEGQKKLATRWMEAFEVEKLKNAPFSSVSLGTQRILLLARSLVKNPPLLILDEPCQGLDEIQIERFRQIVDMVCFSLGNTLIYVSHYEHHIPSCVSERLDLG